MLNFSILYRAGLAQLATGQSLGGPEFYGALTH